MDRVAVAFSGGADSALLLKLMKDALGRENVLAVTVRSEFMGIAEAAESRKLATRIGTRHLTINTKMLGDRMIKANTALRCYYCKKKIFSLIKKEALKRGYGTVIDASNLDDRKDYRPGRLALKQLGILSPLEEAGMTKARIRALSKKAGLPTWDKPANACLATRVPYGETITSAKLRMIEAAETVLRRDAGLGLVRVRCHGNIARIEVPRADMKQLLEAAPGIAGKMRRLGFKYITVDLEGYR